MKTIPYLHCSPFHSCPSPALSTRDLSCFSHVWLFATPWTVAHQAPLSMGSSRQESCSGLSCPPPGDLPDPGIKPMSLISPALAGGLLTASATWEAHLHKPGPQNNLSKEWKNWWMKVDWQGKLTFAWILIVFYFYFEHGCDFFYMFNCLLIGNSSLPLPQTSAATERNGIMAVAQREQVETLFKMEAMKVANFALFPL